MIGRVLRQKMADDARETPARVRERIARTAAGQLATLETAVKFHPITTSNAQAAIDWQNARIIALVAIALTNGLDAMYASAGGAS